MNVVFVSQCVHRAIRRTALVLDAYAWRKGERSWMTPVTQEGLDTIRAELRRTATRQTAVACYVVRGAAGPRLSWTVGSKSAFGANGVVPVGRTSVVRERVQCDAPSLAAGIRLACLLAGASGLCHDFGKFGRMFQRKLHGQGPMKDAVRHEWLSLHLLLADGALNGEDAWREAWRRAGDEPLRMAAITTRADFSTGLRSARAAVEFLVFTHHRMPRDAGNNAALRMLNEGTYLDSKQSNADFGSAGFPGTATLSALRTIRARLDGAVDQLDARREDPLFWRAVASLARMGLILADHSVSSVNLTADPAHGPALLGLGGAVFANTAEDASGRKVLNQQLDWHLQNVGQQAQRMLPRMLRFDPPGLSPQTLERLNARTTGRFEWQSKCATALRTAQEHERIPTLVLNIAGTGTGKTRMNVLAVTALRMGETVRIATGLNLRTLTLQTRDAYAAHLGMNASELACVIGCSLAVRLHDARTDGTASAPAVADLEDEDGNLPEQGFEADGCTEAAPAWLDHFLQRGPGLASVVMSPVVVCTADFLVKAGDPTEKANHALTTLRLMKSDLVLDEIDSYDPKSLVAVMRLVTSAAMFGRHVVASSATLSAPVARALFAAYDLGARMGERSGVRGTATWRHVLIDDKTDAQLQIAQGVDEFDQWFRSALSAVLRNMGGCSNRPAELVRVAFGGDAAARRESVLEAIEQGVVRMHGRHRWPIVHRGQNHKVSIGLVRIANIRNAVVVAKRLAELTHARVCCYHSQLSRIHRFLLEKNLDQILSRHPHASVDPGERFLMNKEVRSAVERSQNDGRAETIFLVVATPVEEIGRDHDFDWGVIEPSSAQAIVQAAGRINRHRLAQIHEPNVGVLQFNFLEAEQSKLAFVRPGLETLSDEDQSGRSHTSHDLETLIDWEAVAASGQVDARLRYLTAVHPFARFDDDASTAELNKHAERFLNSNSPLWMGATTYEAVPLRDASPTETWTKNEQGDYLREEPSPQQPRKRILCNRSSKMTVEHGPTSSWLSWSDEELLAEARRLELSAEQAMQVELRPVRDGQEAMFSQCENAAFGYYKRRPRA